MRLGGIVLLALVLIQLVPAGRSNPPVTGALEAPAEIEAILRRSCYDCHSNETRWPWYSRLAPVSWWLVHHVEEGREHLNFSEWSGAEPRILRHRFEEIDEQIAQAEMPLSSYLILHWSARLSDDERDTLRRWARDAGRR